MRELLVNAIDKQGMTKNEVARLTGLTPMTIIRIYSGRLHPRTVTRIAESLGYKATFGGKDKVFIEPQNRTGISVLTQRQKEKILREVTDALRKALTEL